MPSVPTPGASLDAQGKSVLEGVDAGSILTFFSPDLRPRCTHNVLLGHEFGDFGQVAGTHVAW